ncbi:MAG: ComEC/Rec2 family competence protein [Candidatus Woesebacteria bacterium]|nr:MAG: ComEC/Rec2 family competence protein [Candidatus Woesebacteria bacterium]
MSKYLFFLILIFLVVLRFLTTKNNFKDGDKVRITSSVYSEPSVRGNSQSFSLRGLKIVLSRFPEVHYGDKVVIEGKVKEGVLERAKLTKLSVSPNVLVNIRRSLINFYTKALPEPHGSLIAGITIGAKQSLPYDFIKILQKTGTSHVIVASGMNVTFASEFVFNLLISFVSRKKALLITILSIWIYSIITSFEAPIVRASVMLSFVFVGQYFGRITDTFRILIITFLVMLFINPLWIKDIGFILSFATTLSLVIFESKVKSLISFVPEIFKESLSTSLAAQIGSTPIIFYFFHQFNIFSPLTNALVLWTIPIIMVISSIAGLVGLIVEPVGNFILILCYPMTSWFVGVVNLFSKI